MAKQAPHNDFIDEMIERRTAKNPEFPALYEDAVRSKEMTSQISATRKTKIDKD